MRRFVLLSLSSVAFVVAACTGDSAPADTDADPATSIDQQLDDPDADAAEDVAEPGPRALDLEATLTPLPIDVDALAGTEPVDAAFSPQSLEVVGTHVHAFGQLATPEGSRPAIFRSPLGDGRNWEQVPLDLGDDVITGGLGLVDAPGVSAMWVRDADQRSRVELRRRTAEPILVATIDDADTVTVRNVAADGDGFLAVGVRRDAGQQRPAAWSIRDGEVTPLELPDDPSLERDSVWLDAAVRYQGRYRIAGRDIATDGLVWLDGDSLEELAVVDVPDGLEEAQRIETMLVADDVLWLGGSSVGSVSGELAIWSQTSLTTRFYDRTEAIWGDESTFTSSADRLVAGGWQGDRPYVAIAEGSRTRWWSTRGASINEVGQFGGTMAAYTSTDDSAVTYDGMRGSWQVDFEDAEVDLPPPLWVQQTPTIGSAHGELLTIVSGGNETLRTEVFDPTGDTLIGSLEGSFGVDRHTGSQILTGTTAEFVARPAAARILDGELTPVDLGASPEGQTARAMAVVGDGDAQQLILGHRFGDDGLEPLAWAVDGTEATPDDRFDEELEGRGFLTACGPTTVRTYDEVERYGISWPLDPDGPSEVVLDDELRRATLGPCLETEDATVWMAGYQQLVAIAPDGTVESYERPELRGASGFRMVEVDGDRHLVALVDDDATSSGVRVWTAPLADPSLATVSEALPVPPGAGGLTVQGFDEDTLVYVVTARVGTVTEVFELQLDPV